MKHHELAAAIYRASHLTGEFRLRSGAVSNHYFDKYRFESDPGLLRGIAEALGALVPGDTEVLAGLELGGVPLVTMLSQATQLPAVFVRRAAKTYGTCRLAEGADIVRRKVLLVEDVVTSGGQVLESTRALRDLSAEVSAALCVIDREAGGAELLAAEGVALCSLFRMRELEAGRLEAAEPSSRPGGIMSGSPARRGSW